MKLKLFLSMIPCLLTSWYSVAQAQPEFRGVVNMHGSIISTACAISADSALQIIDMGIVSASEILSNTVNTERRFSIELIDCDFGVGEKFNSYEYYQATFGGDSEGNLFSVNGEAKGVGLEIQSADGILAVPNRPMPSHIIENDNMVMDFLIRLIPN
ncbi:type 1 fimbrial protein, partial [Salmonella enterica]|nr:type 1 fimbrial protein [Salmonella enterica]